MDNETNFLPEDFKVKSTSNYLKLTEGEHTFRIMTSAITGEVYFTSENKPVRSKDGFTETPIDLKIGGRVNQFWAFVVWNYEEKKIQILEITQKSLMLPIQALVKNPKWGNPKQYDLTITRKGSTIMDTEYSVMPNPKEEVSQEAITAFEKTPVNLNALYTGADPFARE